MHSCGGVLCACGLLLIAYLLRQVSVITSQQYGVCKQMRLAGCYALPRISNALLKYLSEFKVFYDSVTQQHCSCRPAFTTFTRYDLRKLAFLIGW